MILDIITTILGIGGSGAILLLLHHYKAKQALMIHQNAKNFDRKQKMYRYFLLHFFETVPLVRNPLREKGNWRIGAYFYNELLCLAGKEVMDAYNRFLLVQDDPNRTDNHYTDAKNALLTEIRKDLTGETIMTDRLLVFAPSDGISEAYRFMSENYSILKLHQLTNLSSFAQIDVEKIASETKLEPTQLRRIKELACKEVQIDLEYRNIIKQLTREV